MMWTALREMPQKHQRPSGTFHIYEYCAAPAHLRKLAERVRIARQLVGS